MILSTTAGFELIPTKSWPVDENMLQAWQRFAFGASRIFSDRSQSFVVDGQLLYLPRDICELSLSWFRFGSAFA